MSEGSPSRDCDSGLAGLAWHPIPVPLPDEGRTCGFEVAGWRLVLCNALGNAYVLYDECPHARAPLSGGRLQGTVLECALHGGKVDVRDGAVVERPIRKRATCFLVRAGAAGLEVGLPSAP